MNFFELLLIAVGLSMDAFAVSVCKGLATKTLKLKNFLIVGLYFGGFQFLMPVIGFFVASLFADQISAYDHWVASVLLVFIGAKMIKESFDKDKNEEEKENSFSFKKMLPLAVATSIDALAIGVSLAFLKVEIFSAAGIIGVITFFFSCGGMLIGNIFGAKFKSKAEFAGGAILVLLGIKILLEHLGVIAF